MTELQFTPVLDQEEQKFITLINQHRAQNGLGPLQVSAALTRAASWMSNDMAQKNYVSHTDSTGRNPFQRIKDYGYGFNTYLGENIAAGIGTGQEALDGWISECDPDASGTCTYAHNLNMLNPNYKVIGIRRVYNPNSDYQWYWTTNFGGVVDELIPVPGADQTAQVTMLEPPAFLGASKKPSSTSRFRWKEPGFENPDEAPAPPKKPKYLAISLSPDSGNSWGWLLLLLIVIIIVAVFLWINRNKS